MRLAGFVIVVFLSLAIAGYAIGVYAFLPLGALVHPAMRASFEAHPVGISIHVFAAAAALLLGPFQFSERLRTSRPRLHRRMGQLYLAIGVVAGGLSGFFMSFHAFGGRVSRLGFGSLAIAWLYTGYRAYAAIRAGDVSSHRRWMVRNFALAFAAVTLRLWLPAAVIAGIEFELAYPVIAWLCWVPNLLVADLLFNSAAAPLLRRSRAV